VTYIRPGNSFGGNKKEMGRKPEIKEVYLLSCEVEQQAKIYDSIKNSHEFVITVY
jgi:hypothetical protein